MRILFVLAPYISLRNPINGSIESYTVLLSNQLASKGHTVDVIAKDADENNSFQVIEFQESALSMKDSSYRPSTETEGQQYFQTLQYGLFDVDRYDIIQYLTVVPEIYEVGALHGTPSIVTLYSSPNDTTKLLYETFVQQMRATTVAISEEIYDEWCSQSPAMQITCHFKEHASSNTDDKSSMKVTDTDVDTYITLYKNCIKEAEI